MLDTDYKSFHEFLDGLQASEESLNVQLEKSKRMKKSTELEYNVLSIAWYNFSGQNHIFEK